LLRSVTEKLLIFDNETLQIFYSGDFRTHQGRIALFFKNKSFYKDNITNFNLTVQPHAALKIVLQPNIQNSIAFNEENKIQIAIECLRPFFESPVLTLNYTATTTSSSSSCNNFNETLLLPITAISFFEPIVADKTTFLTRWKSIEGENTEQQQVFNARNNFIDISIIEKTKKLFTSMHIGLAEGIDTEKSVTGSASFRTGTVVADGQFAAIGAMIRLEADFGLGKFRITVRTKHPFITTALKNFVVDHLA
jgi:hypothetical protein